MTLNDSIAGPQGDLLGLSRLLSGALAEDRGEARRKLIARFQNPGLLRESLCRLRALGYRAVVTLGEVRLFEALGRHPAADLPVPLPIVPNLQGFMREAVEFGMVGAGLRRAWRVGALALAGIGLRGLGRLPALARREFPAMVRSFIELELADFTRYDPPVVFLQAQMTDLALAFNNPRILEAFFTAARARTGGAAGLLTANFGALGAALKSWGLEAEAVIAPFNAAGEQMRPDREQCLHAAKASEFPIWADRLGWPDPPGAADRAVMEQGGLAGAVREDQGLWLGE